MEMVHRFIAWIFMREKCREGGMKKRNTPSRIKSSPYLLKKNNLRWRNKTSAYIWWDNSRGYSCIKITARFPCTGRRVYAVCLYVLCTTVRSIFQIFGHVWKDRNVHIPDCWCQCLLHPVWCWHVSLAIICFTDLITIKSISLFRFTWQRDHRDQSSKKITKIMNAISRVMTLLVTLTVLGSFCLAQIPCDDACK